MPCFGYGIPNQEGTVRWVTYAATSGRVLMVAYEDDVILAVVAKTIDEV